MSTGPAWDLTDPDHPVADFDPNAKRDIPFDWSAWLTDIGSTYAEHEILTDAPLEVLASSANVSTGVVTVRIRVQDGEPYVLNKKYGVTCRLTAADGQSDDRTVWLRLVQK